MDNTTAEHINTNIEQFENPTYGLNQVQMLFLGPTYDPLFYEIKNPCTIHTSQTLSEHINTDLKMEKEKIEVRKLKDYNITLRCITRNSCPDIYIGNCDFADKNKFMGLIEQGGQIFRKKDNARERIFVSLCLPFIPDYGFLIGDIDADGNILTKPKIPLSKKKIERLINLCNENYLKLRMGDERYHVFTEDCLKPETNLIISESSKQGYELILVPDDHGTGITKIRHISSNFREKVRVITTSHTDIIKRWYYQYYKRLGIEEFIPAHNLKNYLVEYLGKKM
ncbi:TPA: hypothetical protein HA235_00970 [Candidatus Woesearchaeota archaeon]|nr:hypothetical protein [Candidatus Woesearchaeota archaeon]HIH31257.1 hypothetical protein [Candidatus Woesearchaeota archaeon]HIH54860.1 hypothetical protein [Candidatus Woesearchaeota archaeon]HIJ01765.1 hypothetical protein [Candidatus Woesearchaeota archaeon]HIJ13528.1 hypothetical protein [Candidatus Woesearchaeota archaeon]